MYFLLIESKTKACNFLPIESHTNIYVHREIKKKNRELPWKILQILRTRGRCVGRRSARRWEAVSGADEHGRGHRPAPAAQSPARAGAGGRARVYSEARAGAGRRRRRSPGRRTRLATGKPSAALAPSRVAVCCGGKMAKEKN